MKENATSARFKVPPGGFRGGFVVGFRAALSTMLVKSLFLILTSILVSQHPLIAQGESAQDTSNPNTDPVFSALHTLSIHVRDTITHDSLFHFLADKLKLPVYYYPLNYGKRKYAGVYAGNLVLEPCGPYSNFKYASNEFRAIFFGLTYEPYKSISQTAKDLTARNISSEAGEDYIYLKDSLLCGENITISFMDKGVGRTNDKQKMELLRYAMTTNPENELGIEYISEIHIGYKDDYNLMKWKDFMNPLSLTDNERWEESRLPEIYICKSNIKEVQSITFKVRSLEKAKKYLAKTNLLGRITSDKIQLNPAETFGLTIFISENER